MKSSLQGNDTEIHLTHIEEKSIIAESIIRTLKSKIYKYMTSISRNKYIDKLDDIVDECNNTYQRTIKMKPGDVKSCKFIEFDKEYNKKGPKFKFDGHVRISRYKIIFAKSYVPNWFDEDFVIKKLKTLFHGHAL